MCQAKVLANYFQDLTFSRYKYYSQLSHWVGLHNSNCTDPRKLLESIVAEPSDLFRRIHFYHGESRNESSVSKVYPTLKNGIISKTDHEKYGRCFTATPTQDMIQRKIQGVKVYPKTPQTGGFAPAILIHMPGDFRRSVSLKHPTMINAVRDFRTDYFMDYAIHVKEDFASKPPCEKSRDYNYDFCISTFIEKTLLQTFGCATPFGIDKTKICTNLTTGEKVFKMYQDIWKKGTTDCKVPCQKISVKPAKLKELPNSQSYVKSGYTTVMFYMNEEVLTSSEVFLYSVLSLIAEVGGYVGLFLGISVNQISTLVDLMYVRNVWKFSDLNSVSH